MKINYREAVLQDEEELFALAKSLATSFKLNKQDFSGIFLELLNDTNTDLIIAEKESRILGYVLAFHHSTFYANGVISWVEEIFVSEEFRGKKIGKKLMEIIEVKAHERGSKLVALSTRRASKFYKAIGYDESAAYFKKTFSKN
ncbi:Ribosomal protein S18 acetylase RimI [Paenibacillus sophorae]|uniref:GNAT family N-acetyltransferase n=1 Tax=Paenibacillus sophorae TaxID=1333845 RepID=A0A1H8ISJ4_9BACL|nr:GNAT family N-acetyltransferase [Paenibacillus sophorae]QWU16049.1 GNAT family N-acetyltransferase [Paenibacillus sophorae]SEN70957.1 Ribosomal protein S18 acetylase RimI [Paenibacillus sophorae]